MTEPVSCSLLFFTMNKFGLFISIIYIYIYIYIHTHTHTHYKIYKIQNFIKPKMASPVAWGCRIHWLHLPNKFPWYDTKPTDSEAPVLELQGMWSISSLQLLPGPLWPGVVVPVRVSYMDQIEIFIHLLYLRLLCSNKWIMLTWIISVELQYLKPFNCMQTNELWLV